jgi:hypothetical protein
MWSEQRAANVSVHDGMLQLALRREKAGSLDYTAGGLDQHDSSSASTEQKKSSRRLEILLQ